MNMTLFSPFRSVPSLSILARTHIPTHVDAWCHYILSIVWFSPFLMCVTFIPMLLPTKMRLWALWQTKYEWLRIAFELFISFYSHLFRTWIFAFIQVLPWFVGFHLVFLICHLFVTHISNIVRLTSFRFVCVCVRRLIVWDENIANK